MMLLYSRVTKYFEKFHGKKIINASCVIYKRCRAPASSIPSAPSVSLPRAPLTSRVRTRLCGLLTLK